jgi:serine/threonine protein kinase
MPSQRRFPLHDWPAVSHSRILEKLGGGGMGVADEAEDVNLSRHVALKFLPEASGKEPQALVRFRERRAPSTLLVTTQSRRASLFRMRRRRRIGEEGIRVVLNI